MMTILILAVIVFCISGTAYIWALLEDRADGIDLTTQARFEQRRLDRMEDAANQEIYRLTHEAFDEMVNEAQKHGYNTTAAQQQHETRSDEEGRS